MPGPLEGIRVFEVSQIVAGPFCGQNLADLGADVIKVEPPSGEGMRVLGGFVPGESKGFHSLNRGKRSLTIDLQHPLGQSLVHRLISGFDVFIINARPGVPGRLKVDYETLKQYRPDLIYMENTGYGTRGPSALRSGSDVVMQAYSGLMAGDRKVDEYGAPDQITATAPADYMAGAAAAMGVCAALFHRERTGEGQYVGSSLLAAGLAMQGTAAGKLPAFDAQVTDPMLARLQAVRERQGSYQEMLEAKGDLLKMMGAAIRLYYGGYQVKDGALILGALTPLNRQQMRRAIGVEDDPTGSPDFDTFAPEAEAVTEQMRARIREIMLTKTMDEWLEAFDREGAPVSKVNFPEEIANDPQVQAMGYMLELEHPLTGPERMPGPMVAMEKTPTGTSTTSPPLAWHTDEVLKEHGLTEHEIEELVQAGAISRPT